VLPAHDLIGRDREPVGKLGESQALVDADLRIGISDRMPDDVRRL